jgi:hypothetical protein
MHVAEEAEVSDYKGDSPFSLTSPPITNRWFLVSLEEVREYRTAVRLYAEEVLFRWCPLPPGSNGIRNGKIVIRRSEGGGR